MRSAMKMTHPRRTPIKSGAPSGWSRAICLPISRTRPWIASLPIKTSMLTRSSVPE